MVTDHGYTMNPSQTTIGAGEFKSTCLKLLDDVARDRVPLVITKHGKPVARLVPMPPDTELFGALAGSVLNEEDIESPIDTEWHASR